MKCQDQPWKIGKGPKKHAKRDFFRSDPVMAVWMTKKDQKQQLELVTKSMTEIWQQHNSEKQPFSEMKDIGDSPPPDTDEIKEAIKKLKSKKARGADGAAAEDLKNLNETQLEELKEIIQHAWKQGAVEQDWVKLKTIAIPKGDRVNATQFRPLTIEPMILKLLNTIILNRTRTTGEGYMHRYQFGCKTGVGPQQAIETILQATMEAVNKDRKYVLVTTDFNKAFDSVRHHVLVNEALKLGDPSAAKLINQN